MTQLQLTCLGDFQVALAGVPLTAFPTDKVQALLVYLVVEGEVHQRSALAQFLWPGYPEESARHSLRQSLHRLRQLLPDAASWLLLTRQTVQFNPAAPVHADVATFRALLAQAAAHAHPALASCPACLARLRQAVDLYQGDFLAGFTVADSDPFEEWRRILQEQLHIQMLDALTQLANAAEAAGDDEGALQAARRQVTLEPWHEDAHRRVMRLLAQRGQRAAAIAQYNRCRQVLAEELGVAPDAATAALYEQIQSATFAKVGREGDKERAAKKGINSEQGQAASAPLIPHAAALPSFPTPLVGRAQALAEIDALLQRPGARLLTLVGPGGMGKTRLAVAVGQAILASETQQSPPNPKYADGLFFVSLAPISTPTALVGAIATVLGMALQDSDPRMLLLQLLRPKQLLLILDNFEHLLVAGSDAVDLVVDLLEAAPGVQIIVTSRERLKLRSEQLYAVPALTFAATASLAEAAATTAVRLFVQSVQRVQADFQLTATNLEAVLRICRLVEGVPLALELAAANAGGLPLNAIADAIAQSAEFLAVEWRDVPERQRSMRAVFAWSWRLLSAAEQRVLRQSTVFRGGFDYAAAQAVIDAPRPLLTRLVDKSLLQWQAAANGEGRYTFHELLRQFADEELQKIPAEATAVATRHARYYLDFVSVRQNSLSGPQARQTADEIQHELNNTRQAWHWATSQHGLPDTQLFAALAPAANGLWKFYMQRGPRTECDQLLQMALQSATAAEGAPVFDRQLVQQRQATLSKLLALRASFMIGTGKLEEAAAIARKAIALGKEVGSNESEALGLVGLAQATAHSQRFAEAYQIFVEALQPIQRYRNQQPSSELLIEAELTTYEYLANLAFDLHGFPTSKAYLRQSLQLCQQLGRELEEQGCHYTLAILAYWSGEYATAQQEYQAAHTLAVQLGNQSGEMLALIGLGELARLQGNYPGAQAALAQGLALAHALNDRYPQISALVGLAHLHCLLGDPAGAAGYVNPLLKMLQERDLLPENRLLILDVLAFYMHSIGQTQQALAYAEQAHQLHKDDIRIHLTLGHLHASRQDWAAAAAAYQTAAVKHTKRGNRAMAAEALAGLAQIALAQGDLTGAQTQIAALLPVLAEYPRAGFNDPSFIYLTCYRVLAAPSGHPADPRAATLLQQGYDLLQQDAAALDEESRRRFLAAVPNHRALVSAYDERLIGLG